MTRTKRERLARAASDLLGTSPAQKVFVALAWGAAMFFVGFFVQQRTHECPAPVAQYLSEPLPLPRPQQPVVVARPIRVDFAPHVSINGFNVGSRVYANIGDGAFRFLNDSRTGVQRGSIGAYNGFREGMVVGIHYDFPTNQLL